jgi:hypothetical protein
MSDTRPVVLIGEALMVQSLGSTVVQPRLSRRRAVLASRHFQTRESQEPSLLNQSRLRRHA